jgi:hypothetical protein
MSAAPRAMPTTGPATTPAIQLLSLDDDSAAGVCPVGSDTPELELELKLERAALARVVARLVDDETADTEPTKSSA